MQRRYGKLIFVLMLSFALIGLSGCFGKDKDATTGEKKAVATENTKKATKVNTDTANEDKTTKSTEQEKTSPQSATTDKKLSQSSKAEKASTKSTATEKGSSQSSAEKSQSTPAGKQAESETTPSKNTAPQSTNPAKEENVGEKEITDFVLKNTRIVQISNISKRTNEKHPDLGPFFVVRGIDLRGEVSEAWVKDMKIYEMVTQSKN